MNGKLIATVTEIIKQTPDVWSVNFLVDGQPLPAEAGQYISVYFSDTDVPEGKAYSLSSCPEDNFSQITVKRVGLFSNKITDLKVGDTLKISASYGFFDAFSDVFIDSPAYFIGCGVGISPLYSIVRNQIKSRNTRPLTLFYTNKTDDDIIFHKSLERLTRSNNNFSVNFYVTRQSDSRYYRKRFVVDDIKNISADSYFYLCGTTEFTRSIWQQLIQVGVSEKNISVEVFFGANNGD